MATPKFLLAYDGSSACSTSIKAAIPPFFCASAITEGRWWFCRRNSRSEDFDHAAAREAAHASAASSEIDPVEITETGTRGVLRPETQDRSFAKLLFDPGPQQQI